MILKNIVSIKVKKRCLYIYMMIYLQGCFYEIRLMTKYIKKMKICPLPQDLRFYVFNGEKSAIPLRINRPPRVIEIPPEMCV